MSNLRPRTTRLRHLRPAKDTRATVTEIYPGLNDITDALEALPTEIVKYFTLYKEIDAKYIAQIPLLHHRIDQFRRSPKTPENQEKRVRLIKEVSSLLTKMLPCMEEKMHVASIAADRAVKYVDRINDDFELIVKGEVPDYVRYGQLNHPAMITDSKTPDNKSAQSQRSESRREALAAKKVANETDGDEGATSGSGRGRPRREKENTPVGITTKKRKTVGAGSSISTVPPPNPMNLAIPLSAQSALATPANVHATLAIPHKPESENVSRPGTPSGKRARTATKKKQEDDYYVDSDGQKRNSAGEPVYCYCNQVSYGEMVGCDGDDCKREWFHLPCTGLATLPRGKWYCDECDLRRKKGN